MTTASLPALRCELPASAVPGLVESNPGCVRAEYRARFPAAHAGVEYLRLSPRRYGREFLPGRRPVARRHRPAAVKSSGKVSWSVPPESGMKFRGSNQAREG